LSYAAGWELGRLLALSSGAYAADTLATQRALSDDSQPAARRTRSGSAKTLLASSTSTELGALQSLLHADAPVRSFATWLEHDLGAAAAQAGRRRGLAPPPAPLRAQTRSVAGDGIAAAPSARPTCERCSAALSPRTSPPAAARTGVVNTLANLRLLINVPFAHLVPDARMLPPESIRFFYVDRTISTRSATGPASIGVQSSRDASQAAVVRGTVRQAATARAFAARATAIRRPQLLQGAQSGDPVAGFLLRSAVVSGWPGLEVKAYADTAGNAIATDPTGAARPHAGARRHARPLPQVPARIEFDEPKEALAFGVEDAVGGDVPVV